MATVQVSQSGTLVTTNLTSPMDASLATTLVVANFPTPQLDASQAGTIVTTNFTNTDMRLSQAAVMVVGRGRVYNPKLRVWTYTLDGHEYYVLRLGDDKTLVYDLTTQQWSWFTYGELDFWRPNTGMNWYSAGTISNQYGSNIICGDDTFGHLWVLDPEQGFDDNSVDPAEGEARRFPREATGQVITRQRVSLPVYEVYLTASFGEPVETGDTVELSYSDDLGNTYVSAGEIPTNAGDFKQQFSWRSLGLITQSGRLFKISDDGAFARIDGLDCHIGGIDG